MNPPYQQSELPESIQKVLTHVRAELKPRAILLFGSRARNDGSPTSDFDFAVQGVAEDERWVRFRNYIRYDAPTIYQVDFVRYESISEELRKRIDEEGRTVL